MTKLERALADMKEAWTEHDQKAEAVMVPGPIADTLRHGHRMAAIAYQNAHRWLESAMQRRK